MNPLATPLQVNPKSIGRSSESMLLAKKHEGTAATFCEQAAPAILPQSVNDQTYNKTSLAELATGFSQLSTEIGDEHPIGEISTFLQANLPEFDGTPTSLTKILPAEMTRKIIQAHHQLRAGDLEDLSDTKKMALQNKFQLALGALQNSGVEAISQQFTAQASVTQKEWLKRVSGELSRHYKKYVAGALTERKSASENLASSDIEIPSPQVVHLETLKNFSQQAAPNMIDIDSLIELVMFEAGRGSEQDLQALIDDMQANTDQQKKLRDYITSLKQNDAALKSQLQVEYNRRCSLPATDPSYIDPKVTDFTAFQNTQKINVPNECDPDLTDVPSSSATPSISTDVSVPTSPLQNSDDPASSSSPQNLNSNNSVTTFDLTSSDCLALQDYYGALTKDKPSSFLEFLKTPSPLGPGLNFGQNNNDAVEKFFQNNAADPAKIEDPNWTKQSNQAADYQKYKNAKDAADTLQNTYDTLGKNIDNNHDYNGAGGKYDGDYRTNHNQIEQQLQAFGSTYLGSDLAAINAALKTYYAAALARSWIKVKHRPELNDAEKNHNGKAAQVVDAFEAALQNLKEKIKSSAHPEAANDYAKLRLQLGAADEKQMVANKKPKYADAGFTNFFAGIVRPPAGKKHLETFDVSNYDQNNISNDDVNVHKILSEYIGDRLNQFPFKNLPVPNPIDETQSPDPSKRYLPVSPDQQALINIAKEYNQPNHGKYSNTQTVITEAPIEGKSALTTDSPTSTVTSPTSSITSSPPDPTQQGQITLTQFEAQIDAWQSKKDSLADLTQEQQLRLQLYQDRYSKFFQALSDIMKKSSDTQNAIITNMK